MIRVCASYGIEAGRLEKATGVWLEGSTPRARKICAIGVRSSHYVTMHGLALNVNTDLRYFSSVSYTHLDVYKRQLRTCIWQNAEYQCRILIHRLPEASRSGYGQ